MCCMFAPLQHEASQAREVSADGAGASGGGRGFKALLTHQAIMCCMFANLQHGTSTRGVSQWSQRQRKRGAGLRPADSHCFHVLHARPPATRGIARTRGVNQWSRRQRGKRGLEGRRLTGRACAAC